MIYSLALLTDYVVYHSKCRLCQHTIVCLFKYFLKISDNNLVKYFHFYGKQTLPIVSLGTPSSKGKNPSFQVFIQLKQFRILQFLKNDIHG